MRRRELIAKLKDDQRELRNTCSGFFSDRAAAQSRETRRMVVFHRLEALLPEIIEKLEPAHD